MIFCGMLNSVDYYNFTDVSEALSVFIAMMKSPEDKPSSCSIECQENDSGSTA